MTTRLGGAKTETTTSQNRCSHVVSRTYVLTFLYYYVRMYKKLMVLANEDTCTRDYATALTTPKGTQNDRGRFESCRGASKRALQSHSCTDEDRFNFCSLLGFIFVCVNK